MKIILVGKSNAGKSFFSTILKTSGHKEIISTTTRPKREYEEDGVHYNFITDKEFKEKEKNNEFIEVEEFNEWHYGITRESFEDGDVLILTPRGYTKIKKIINDEDTFVILMESTIKVKKQRIEARDMWNNESFRRWANDDIDFDEFERNQEWDIKMTVNCLDGITKLVKIIKHI